MVMVMVMVMVRVRVMVMVRVIVMVRVRVRDAKCWNIFPVEVAVCSSWRRGQESGVTGSGTQPDIYTVSTQYLHSIYSIYTVSTQYLHSIYTVSTVSAPPAGCFMVTVGPPLHARRAHWLARSHAQFRYSGLSRGAVVSERHAATHQCHVSRGCVTQLSRW